MTEPTLGQQLDAIGERLDAATAAWAAAGHPATGDLADAREAVFADLRAWTARAEQRHGGAAGPGEQP